MKKTLLTAAVMCLTTPAFSQTTNSTSTLSPLTGAYVGVMAGYTFGNSDSDFPGVSPEISGGEYGLFAGYKIDALLNRTVNRTGMGLNGAIEIFYNWSDADDTSGGIAFEKDHEYGISFRPGLSFLDSVSPFSANPYGILGWRRASFEAPALGVDETYDGFELGLGTELIAYDDVGLRLEYSHVWYEDQSGFDPSDDSIRMGLAYHF